MESVSGEVWRGAGCMCGSTAGNRGGGLAAGDCWLRGSTQQTYRIDSLTMTASAALICLQQCQ